LVPSIRLTIGIGPGDPKLRRLSKALQELDALTSAKIAAQSRARSSLAGNQDQLTIAAKFGFFASPKFTAIYRS